MGRYGVENSLMHTNGDNVIIGANSIVTHDIPSNSMAVGAPAKVVKQIQESVYTDTKKEQ